MTTTAHLKSILCSSRDLPWVQPNKIGYCSLYTSSRFKECKILKIFTKIQICIKNQKAQLLKDQLKTIPILSFPRSKSDNLNASNDNNSSPRINLMSQPAATCSAYSPTKLAIVLRIPPQESNRKKTPRFCLLTDKMGLMKWIWKHLLPSHSSRMKTMPARS